MVPIPEGVERDDEEPETHSFTGGMASLGGSGGGGELPGNSDGLRG